MLEQMLRRSKGDTKDDENRACENTQDSKLPQRRNVQTTDIPVRVEDATKLVFSSLFFLIPGCYAAANQLYFYFVVSFITTAVSINYWRHAIDGPRRHWDLFTAKASFVIYFISGCFFVRDVMQLTVGIPGCLLIIIFYNLGLHYWNKDSPYWVYFHMGFHFWVAFEQGFVIYCGALIEAYKFFEIK